MPAERPIRVLHLRDSPWIDGPGRTILETGAHVDRARIDYHIGAFVAPGKVTHPLVEAARQRDIKVVPIEDNGGLRGGIVGRIAALVDELGIDVLHTSEFRSNVIARLVRARRKLLRVTTVHGWIANDARGRVFRVLDKALLRQFDRVIFVSAAARALVPRWWIGDERARILYNALVLESYGSQYVDAVRRRCAEDGHINILKVGRLSPEKGHALLLEAFHALAGANPQLRLLIVGTGPLEAQLRAQVERLGLSQQVEFLGFVHDMPPLYARADLIVQSSFTEGMPNVILEGAYLRVPMLATRVGGTDEVMGEGIGGELIAPGSAAELEQGLRRFLADPERFAAMAARAPQRIRAHFSFAARTDALSRIYEELM